MGDHRVTESRAAAPAHQRPAALPGVEETSWALVLKDRGRGSGEVRRSCLERDGTVGQGIDERRDFSLSGRMGRTFEGRNQARENILEGRRRRKCKGIHSFKFNKVLYNTYYASGIFHILTNLILGVV